MYIDVDISRHLIRPSHAIFGDGYRKLEDDDVLQEGDQTGRAGMLLSGQESWSAADGDFVRDYGKSIAAVCDSGDIDGEERLFRRLKHP